MGITSLEGAKHRLMYTSPGSNDKCVSTTRKVHCDIYGVYHCDKFKTATTTTLCSTFSMHFSVKCVILTTHPVSKRRHPSEQLDRQ